MEGYNLMLDDKEYIVYINDWRVPEVYRKTETEKKHYMYTSQKYGKFPLDDEKLSTFYSLSDFNSDLLKYKDIKDTEYIALNERELQLYNDIKEHSVQFGIMQ